MPICTGVLVLVAIWASVNLLTIVLMGIDKAAARSNARRVPEVTFFNLVLLGGGIGVLVGARLFHHKTRKSSFIRMMRIAVLIHVLSLFLTAIVVLVFITRV